METAVLNELIGAVLVPNENKGKAVVHLIEYRPDCRSQTRPVEPETKLIDYSAPNVPSEFSIPPPNFALLRMHALPAAPHATQQQPSLLNSSQVGRLNAGLLANFTSFAPAQATTSKTVKSSEIPVVTLDSDTESRKNNSNPPCSSTQLSIEDEAKAAAEQKSRQAAISQLVEQIIVTAKHNDQRNPVLKMLLSFANPKAILIQLATKQPQTLQQFISVIRNPNLNVPQELLEVLHAKLTALAEQTEAKIPSKSSVEEYDPSKPLRDESSKRSESHKRDRRDDRKDESEEKRRKKLKQLEILERVEQYRKLKDSAKPKLTAAVDDISKVSVAADKAPAPFEVVNSRIMPVPSAHYQDFMPTGDGSAAGFNIGDPSQSYWPPFPYPQQMLGFPGVNPVFPNLFMGGFRPPFS